MIQLTVTPKTSLADQPVKIHVSGLAPGLLVTLQSSLTDERGITFQARALYRADEAGQVDFEKAAALGGDYAGVWPMGLFWFLKPEKLFQRLIKKDVMGSPFQVRIDLFDSFLLMPQVQTEPVASCTVERWYVTPGTQRIPIKEGRVRGTLFLPPGPGPFPGVIDMFGGAGGLIEFRASLLASRGFAVLAVAFFAYDDLPLVLKEVDLEYFEEATNLLLKHPKVRGPGIGVIGVSQGGMVVLSMATFLEQVVAAVWINGASCMYGPSLRYRDIYIPAVPYIPERLIITEMGALDNYHVFGDPRDPAHAASAIPVEKAKGEVLFVVGEADRNFNSKLFAELAIERMKKHGKKNYTLLSYPGAGHLIEPPGSPLCSISVIRGNPKPVHWGGEPEAHAKAQEHSWEEIIKFLKLHLGSSGTGNL
ncbi:acyl-coenzyme A amino acid N-acyltransferase 2-like [Alligator sinensis]|uniref:Acyl-coenzyme A amino acid N-acyltransferase 2-like n=1 Tax=Alligator sinensis TaxID=38654 RepID=A0A1U7RMJ2_ALLSI|nr:acyl-coenzyme A amino acid N-acyltransferase 2-like [Alligator sinensis]XP_006026093.1 acyl-coenzyme A amino acid N-acyltransferase 2-like [Alligator sinensis]